MKKTVALLLCAAMVLCMAACGAATTQPAPTTEQPAAETEKAESPVEQKITYNAVESPSYDPIRDTQSGEVVSHMFEGLTCWSQGEIVNGQAKSIECSKDGLAYTITLRDDIFWTDGQPVTAQDFYYSWMRELDPETAAKYVANLYIIKNASAFNAGSCSAEEVGIEIKDDKTLIVTMESPVSYFEELLAFKAYLPVRQDTVEANGETWAQTPDTCISNGPFKMIEYTPGEKMLLTKNEKYYGADDITINDLEIRFITDSSVELMSYQTGEIQIAVKPSADTCAQYGEEALTISKLSTMWLVPNCQDEVLKDARVRAALSLAIDRQLICDNVLKGGETPAYTIVPKGVVDPTTGKSFADGNEFKEDVERAKELLAEAGYPNGEGFPVITYGTSSGTEYEEVAQTILAMWKANLGIEATIEVEDSSAFIAHRGEGYFDVARYTMAGTYADPIASLSLYLSTAKANDSNYMNPKYDETLAAARAAVTSEEKYALYHELDNMLTEDTAVIPLYYPSIKFLIKPEVQGVGVNYLGMLEFKSAHIA